MRTVYMTDDGSTFTSKEDAARHEKFIEEFRVERHSVEQFIEEKYAADTPERVISRVRNLIIDFITWKLSRDEATAKPVTEDAA